MAVVKVLAFGGERRRKGGGRGGGGGERGCGRRGVRRGGRCVTRALLGQGAGGVRPYTVRRGDTAFSIAQKRGFSVEDLSALNKMEDINFLLEGQTILLPAGKFSQRDKQMLGGLQAGTGERSYTVRSGEKIQDILKSRGITLAEVQQLNPNLKNLSKLRGGQIIILPSRFSTREQEAFLGYVPLEYLEDRQPLAWMKELLQYFSSKPLRPYTIRNGDTLSTICSKRGLDVKEVVGINRSLKMDLETLRPGQVILLPGSTLSERDKMVLAGIDKGSVRTYPVRLGESLEDIIAKRKISREEVAALNPEVNLKRLQPGINLLLPSDKFTIREREVLQGTGTVPSEFFAPSATVNVKLLVGLGVFFAVAAGAVFGVLRERKELREKIRRKRERLMKKGSSLKGKIKRKISSKLKQRKEKRSSVENQPPPPPPPPSPPLTK